MKKICEIYDISKEYEMSESSVLIVVSDLNTDMLCKLMPEFEKHASQVMTTDKWNEFLKVNKIFQKNENKFNMREIRQSKMNELSNNISFSNDVIDNIFDNRELKNQIIYALSFLSETPKRRFLRYYYEHRTYREIAKDEGRSLSAIYESIHYAKKTFLKHFYEYPKTP